MKLDLYINEANDYARDIRVPVYHPHVAIIHYDEAGEIRHSLNRIDCYGIFLQREFPESLTYGIGTYHDGDGSLIAFAPGQIGGKRDDDTRRQYHGCLLWFDHNSEDGSYGGKADQQIPFKMDVEGGIVELLNRKGSLMDAVSYPPATTRCSYARTVDGGTTWGLTSQPTPKHTNTGSTFAEERLTAPQTDRKGSVFSAPFTLKVNIPTGTTLHYTTDGATPVPGKSMVSEAGTFSITETSIPAELSRQIIKEVSGFEGVHGVYDLILHNYGPDVKIGSLHINVYDTMSAHKIHGPSTSSGCISGQHR